MREHCRIIIIIIWLGARDGRAGKGETNVNTTVADIIHIYMIRVASSRLFFDHMLFASRHEWNRSGCRMHSSIHFFARLRFAYRSMFTCCTIDAFRHVTMPCDACNFWMSTILFFEFFSVGKCTMFARSQLQIRVLVI